MRDMAAVYTHLPASSREALAKAAQEDDRSMSSFVRNLVHRELRARGLAV